MSDANEPSEPSPPTDVLCFEQLHVRRFNGIEHGLEVELCSGVNVIHGANATGKTTLAHAIRGLLWPDQIEAQLPIVEGRFVLDGSTWRVELEGNGCGFTKDQNPASRPALPPASHGPRYHLYLHDLLGSEDGEEAFAQRILKEAQGGIDVEGTAEELGFEVPNRHRAQNTKTVEELRKKRDDTKGTQEDLRRREKTLDDLREKKADAERAAKRAAALEQAKEVAKAREAHHEAEAALTSFPDVMDEVQGNEDETLDALQKDLSTAEDALQEAEDQIQSAESTIEASRIPREGLPEGRVEELRGAVSTIREQERTVREHNSEVKATEEKEGKAWERLPAGVDKEAALHIDLPELEQIESHVNAAEALQGKREALETARELFDEADPDPATDTLQEGLKHLHHWLQHPDAGASSGSEWRHWAVLIGGFLVAGSGGGLLLLGTGLATGVGIGLIALGVIIAGAEWQRGRQAGAEATSDRRVHYERQYERLGLDEPDDWSRDAVEQRADALLDQFRKAHVAAEKQETWDRIESEHGDLDAREEKLDQERQRLAEELGIDPDVGSLTLPVLLERLTRWQHAYDDLDAKRAALETSQQEAEKCRTRLNETLEEYGLGPIEDASEAEGAVNTLETARNEFREAERDLEQAREQKESAIQDRDNAETEIEDLYRRLNLEPGDETRLRELIGQYEEYQDATKEARETEATLEAERRQLRRMDAHEEDMEMPIRG